MHSKGGTSFSGMKLPVEEELPFICLKESVPEEDTGNDYTQGRFAFLKETFHIAERYILDSPPGHPVWIDEIGGLEIKGLGYDTLMKTLLKSDRAQRLLLPERIASLSHAMGTETVKLPLFDLKTAHCRREMIVGILLSYQARIKGDLVSTIREA